MTSATVAALWRHPIKSHGREALNRVTLRAGQTMPWDRVWAVAHEASTADGSAWVPCANFSGGSKAPGLMGMGSALRRRTPGMAWGLLAIVLCLVLRAGGALEGLELVHHPQRTSITSQYCERFRKKPITEVLERVLAESLFKKAGVAAPVRSPHFSAASPEAIS